MMNMGARRVFGVARVGRESAAQLSSRSRPARLFTWLFANIELDRAAAGIGYTVGMLLVLLIKWLWA